jgi:hypothetical protein
MATLHKVDFAHLNFLVIGIPSIDLAQTRHHHKACNTNFPFIRRLRLNAFSLKSNYRENVATWTCFDQSFFIFFVSSLYPCEFFVLGILSIEACSRKFSMTSYFYQFDIVWQWFDCSQRLLNFLTRKKIVKWLDSFSNDFAISHLFIKPILSQRGILKGIASTFLCTSVNPYWMIGCPLNF